MSMMCSNQNGRSATYQETLQHRTRVRSHCRLVLEDGYPQEWQPSVASLVDDGRHHTEGANEQRHEYCCTVPVVLVSSPANADQK